jgi:mRNA interferase RelE/StbE
MKLRYTEEAVENLRRFDRVEQAMIADKLDYLAANFDALKHTKKVTRLRGTQYPDQYRFVIARKIRAIFRIEEGVLVLLVLRIGRRKDVYG